MATSKKWEQDKKVDEAVAETFPASDPTATGKATSTEPPKRPKDRKAPLAGCLSPRRIVDAPCMYTCIPICVRVFTVNTVKPEAL